MKKESEQTPEQIKMLTLDESMFSCYGKGNVPGGLLCVIKIKRKPRGIGPEIKTLAEASTRIMPRLEVNEGKQAMAKKKNGTAPLAHPLQLRCV